MAARVTPDGKYLFFMSDRPGSARERSIYWVDAKVIEELRPRE
jgi:Tol biopolymer transport system component